MLTILRQYYRVDAGLLDLISLIYTDSPCVLRRRIIDQLPHQYRRQRRVHFISYPLLGLP